MHLDDLTTYEKTALHGYKANSPYSGQSCIADDLNAHLRQGLFVCELGSEKLRDVAVGLDSVFARCHKTSADMELFRGLGFRQHLPLHNVGSRFRSLEFWSTARDIETVDKFLNPITKPGHGAVLTLKIPAGMPAYDMETLDGAGGGEGEVLLPRGVVWTISEAKIRKADDITPYLRKYFETIADVTLIADPWVRYSDPKNGE